ncbi:MAG: hypothetical protein ABIQ11_09975 [Saprospiraceae bacterium]
MIKKYQPVFYTLLAALLLSVSMGLYNNFPILYPDSAAYLASGIMNQLPNDRPIFYGWFLRHTHMMDNLFLSIFAQGLLATLVIYLFFYYFSPARHRLVHFLISIFLLTILTGYSFFVSYLMPDIFTALFLLSLAIILFADVKKPHLWFLIPLCIYSVILHNSHFLIFFISLIVLGIWLMIKRKSGLLPFSMKRWLIVLGMFVTGVVFSVAVNYAYTKKIFLSQKSHVFFMSRMHEVGILSRFLDLKCIQANYSLCAYKDSMTHDFIWDPASPFYKTGGWESSEVEYNQMIRELLTTPRFIKDILVAWFFSTVQQLGSFEIEPQGRNHLTYIEETFPAHKYQMNVSMQNRENGRLSFDKINERQHIFVYGSFIILVLLLLFYRKWTGQHRQLVIFLLWAIVINAFVCSAFSTVLTRYQGRVIFIIPLILLVILPAIDFRALFSAWMHNRSDGDSKLY